jgi:hypothetical protein
VAILCRIAHLKAYVSQGNTLAVLVEKHDRVITALLENWKRISSVAQALKIDWLGGSASLMGSFPRKTQKNALAHLHLLLSRSGRARTSVYCRTRSLVKQSGKENIDKRRRRCCEPDGFHLVPGEVNTKEHRKREEQRNRSAHYNDDAHSGGAHTKKPSGGGGGETVTTSLVVSGLVCASDTEIGLNYENEGKERTAMIPLYCIVDRKQIPEERVRRGAKTCDKECQRLFRRAFLLETARSAIARPQDYHPRQNPPAGKGTVLLRLYTLKPRE